MELQHTASAEQGERIQRGFPLPFRKAHEEDFRALLAARSATALSGETPPVSLTPAPEMDASLPALSTPSMSRSDAISAYRKLAEPVAGAGKMSDLEKYKDDQLLIHPGGDHYDLERKEGIAQPEEQKSFWGRIGKDLSDAFSNVKNFFDDLLFGAKIHYRDRNGQIQEGKRKGLLGSVVDFFKDVGSALSFGTWRPDGEAEPQGFLKRVGFFFSKMKEALFGDVVQGVGGSLIHMAKDLLFAGWNALEVIPDATLGNLEVGQKATTAVFDHGQVVLDYLTDIVPFGDAWVRVHSLDLENSPVPVLHNLQKPEHSPDDDRWRHVRNTPFRKTIETIGSLLMDVLTIKVIGRTDISSEERRG